MSSLKQLKLIVWGSLTITLLFSFWFGIAISSYNLNTLTYLILTLPILGNFVLIGRLKIQKDETFLFNKIILKKKIIIWSMLSINLLFAFIIGLTIPLLVSESRDNLGYIMIPLQIILNYIILDRYHYYQKHINDRKDIE